MGKIFCLMGKSASGKDTLYKKLMDDRELSLKPIVPYTTRPIRSGEREGCEYHFRSVEEFNALEAKGSVIESRTYHTCHGDWIYFTVDDENINLAEESYLIIGTLEAYAGIRAYYKSENVIPIYIQLDDGERLERALNRERSQKEPKYEEMCRRFLADARDFSRERLSELAINEYYDNVNLEECFKALKEKIWTLK